jgi:hypothetical protein
LGAWVSRHASALPCWLTAVSRPAQGPRIGGKGMEVPRLLVVWPARAGDWVWCRATACKEENEGTREP